VLTLSAGLAALSATAAPSEAATTCLDDYVCLSDCPVNSLCDCGDPGIMQFCLPPNEQGLTPPCPDNLMVYCGFYT
jgi:hypothetical protein